MPTVRSSVLLPDMFEPLTISNRVCGVRNTSLRTMRALGTSGCPRLAPSNCAGPPSSTKIGKRIVRMLVCIGGQRAERFVFRHCRQPRR